MHRDEAREVRCRSRGETVNPHHYSQQGWPAAATFIWLAFPLRRAQVR